MDKLIIIEKMKKEAFEWGHYSFLPDKFKQDYLFYNVSMNSYLMYGNYHNRKMALHYLNKFRKYKELYR